MPLSDYELDVLTARMPRSDISTIGSLISHKGFLPGALAGTAIGVLGSSRRRRMEERLLRDAAKRRLGKPTTEDIRRLAKRMSPAAGSVVGTAGLSGLLSAGLGGLLGGGRGAVASGIGGAGFGAALGALHTTANRARIRRLIGEETR